MTISLGRAALFLFFLAISLPLLGLPGCRYGWYAQLEFLVGGLWAVGALAALWHLVLLKQKPRLAAFLYRMPVVWSWIPLGALSIVISLFQKTPLQSWTSNPQLGDGILTMISLFFLSPLFVLLSRLKTVKFWILWPPTVIVVIISTLTVLGVANTPVPSLKFWQWAPMFFSDYLTYFVIALGVIYWHVRPKEKKVMGLDCAFLPLLLVLTYYAQNHSILLGFGLVLFTYGALRLPLFTKIPLPKKLAYCAGAGLFMMTLLICVTNFLDNPPASLSSIVSRAHIAQFTFMDYLYGEITFSKIMTFLFGHAWGEYNNVAVSNFTLTHDFSLYKDGNLKSNLEFIDRDQVNSHNIFLEYFLALGVVGLTLFCYLQYKIITSLKKNSLFIGTFFVITLGTLLVFWFQLPHTLPLITFAYCLLFSKTPPKGQRKFSLKKAPWVIGVLVFILGSFSITQFATAYYYTTSLAIRPGDDLFDKIDETVSTPWLAYDRYTGAHRTRQIMHGLSNDIFAFLLQEKDPPLDKAAQKLLKIARSLQEDIPLGSSATALILSMNIFAQLSTHPVTKKLLQQDPQYEKMWHHTAKLLSHQLPYRSDLFVSYFSFLLGTQHYEKIKELTSLFMKKNPNDPLSHWFSGVINLQKDRSYEKGLCLMNRAIDLGIVRYIPVPKEQIKKIQGAAQGLYCPDSSPHQLP